MCAATAAIRTYCLKLINSKHQAPPGSRRPNKNPHLAGLGYRSCLQKRTSFPCSSVVPTSARPQRSAVKSGIYIQPSTSRLSREERTAGITPTPYHKDMHIDNLVRALIEVWEERAPARDLEPSRTKAPRARSLRLLHARETLEPRRNRTSSATPTKAVLRKAGQRKRIVHHLA